MRSDWRGVPRKTSAPNRARSCRESITAIISIAQQASPNCIGQIALRRAQLITESTVVVTTFSSKRFVRMLTRKPPFRSGPLQCSALPRVEIPDHQDREEDHHFDESEERQLVEEDRPRKEKDRLDVEHHEEDG